MSPSEAVVWMLVLVLFAILLWRVWRLEDRVGRKGPSGPDWEHMIKVEGRINDTYGYARGVDRALGDLARALGYEWKRTDAKEGWEKKAATKPSSYWGLPDEDELDSLSYSLFGVDRRKADRRKPALTYTANAQGADGKVRKVSSKKRRAH